MLMARGGLPAWMEILKLNIPEVPRGKVFAYASTFEYLGAGFLPFAFGWLLDGYFQSWRWIFPITAFISILSALIQYRIPINLDDMAGKIEATRSNLVKQIVQPWKNAWNLLRVRPDFSVFQVGFMIGGAGVLIFQTALPQYFIDVLQLSYMELALALTLCKGIGFALTSSLWAKWIHKVNIYRFIGWVTLVACLTPFCLIAAKFNIAWVYFGYFVYGIMMAGSELSWNMSGPIFAKNEDSSVYTTVNVVTVGLRGCFVPALGTLLTYWTNSTTVLMLGGILCLLATWRMAAYSRTQAVVINAE